MKTKLFLYLVLLVISIIIWYAIKNAELDIPENIQTHKRHLRIDLTWEQSAYEFEIERSMNPEGPFKRISRGIKNAPVHSDFIGEHGKVYYYRIRAVQDRGLWKRYSKWSEIVKGESGNTSPDKFLTEIQEASFRYFWDYAHPVSGLAREGIGTGHPSDLCTIGASGMGCFNIVVGIERGFISREQGIARAIKILKFLYYIADRFHGAFPHWLNGATGKVVPFTKKDDGADLVETSFLIEGILFWREYFNADNEQERLIRELSDKIWREVEWQWFIYKVDDELHLSWHWSPTIGWRGMTIWGFTECQITYVLGLASPTYPIPMKCYLDGWQDNTTMNNPREVLGVKLDLFKDFGPPLFFTHYSYMGLDPKKVYYGKGKTYFNEFIDFVKVQVKYAERRKNDYKGYGPLWGLTASFNPDGYRAHRPGERDNGTITPTGAISSMPYAPQESKAFIDYMYKNYATELWGEFGFYDAFNMSRDWIGKHYLGIDAGPIAPMIENYRSGLCWKYFMNIKEIKKTVEELRIEINK